VFAGFTPTIGAAAKRAPYVFLGNIDPTAPAGVLDRSAVRAWSGSTP